MRDWNTELGLARSGQAQVVILPRDPEAAYVYWELPEDHRPSSSATVTVLTKDSDGLRTEVHQFDVKEALGSRFVSVSHPGAVHICELKWSGGVERSEPTTMPRREAGNEGMSVVRVTMTDRGLKTEPAELDGGVLGRVESSPGDAPSSGEW